MEQPMQPEFNPFQSETEFFEPKASERDALIKNLQDGNFTLSYSSLKEFAVSPYAFLCYKLQEYKQTPAMLLGELVHAYVFEPEKVSEKYRIGPSVSASTADGKNAWAEFYIGLTGDALHTNKSGNYVLPKMSDLIGQIRQKTDLQVVPGAMDQEARFRARRIAHNGAARHVLDMATEAEIPIETVIEGIAFRGRIDGKGVEMVCDLKNMPDATLKAAEREILKRKLHWQAYIYQVATGCKTYYIICNDPDGEVSVHEISGRMLDLAADEVRRCISEFKDCITQSMLSDGVWYMSQDFRIRNDGGWTGINRI